MSLGQQLYELVEAFADLGDHRTGTPVDERTRAWFAAELERRGAKVHEAPYDFERFDADAVLRAGDTTVACLPLHYSAVGRWTDVAAHAERLDILGGTIADLAPVWQAATAAGRPAAVVATGDQWLVALNRDPRAVGSVPTVLVAGHDAALVTDQPLRLTMEAALTPARSANVIGRFGDAAGADPVVITTPLTGWFGCAAERGTGIAVALELAGHLARERPTLVVGTTGHELDHLGARHFVGDAAIAPAAVVHLGASVAAGNPTSDGAVEFDARRVAFSTAGADERALLQSDVGPAAITVVGDLPSWPGEGQEWRGFGVPVLSFVGGFDRFHTADDLPSVTTSPQLLECAAASIRSAVRRLLNL